jgi:hypothetical protein
MPSYDEQADSELYFFVNLLYRYAIELIKRYNHHSQQTKHWIRVVVTVHMYICKFGSPNRQYWCKDFTLF